MDMTSKSGWETIKDTFKNRCVICNKPEKKVGELERVHIKEHTRVRYLILPMCANHHKMYINNQLSNKELKKIDIIIIAYAKSRPVRVPDSTLRVSSTGKVGLS